MNVYLAIDSGGYLCTNSLCALIAASLGASQRSRNDVPLNRFAKEESVKRFEQRWSRIVYRDIEELTCFLYKY